MRMCTTLKTVGFSGLLLVLLLSFLSWLIYPVFIPKEYTKGKIND
jgi:hypothetical protein